MLSLILKISLLEEQTKREEFRQLDSKIKDLKIKCKEKNKLFKMI